MLCGSCGGRVTIETVPFIYQGNINLGEYEAEVCHSCGERIFSEEAFGEIEKRAKMLKIWGHGRIPEPEFIESTVSSVRLPTVSFSTLFPDINLDLDLRGVIPQ